MDQTIISRRPVITAFSKKSNKRKWGLLTLPLIFLAVCCGLALVGGIVYSLMRPAKRVGPVVFFRSPAQHQKLIVGSPYSVQAVAYDDRKVTRLELWVNDILLSVQTANLSGGISPFPLLVNWLPESPGEHTLTTRAFNSRGGRAQASIVVEAFLRMDSDSDGAPDEIDHCPDQPGTITAGGCPDQDSDGVTDANDACPNQSGLPTNDGCPSPSSLDQDGDGMVNESDVCPDVAGSPLADGCPDSDNDGIANQSDACPSEPGPTESGGCSSPDD